MYLNHKKQLTRSMIVGNTALFLKLEHMTNKTNTFKRI